MLQLDLDLRRLGAMRARWDELLGHLAMLLQWTGLWKDMGFASSGRYCAERLGMAERTVAQRDLGCCQVPGCTRAAAHAHHVDFLSRGGSDDLWNQVGLCAAHHLHGVHPGYVRVSGRAPDALTWELGRGWDGKPLEVFEPAPVHSPAARRPASPTRGR